MAAAPCVECGRRPKDLPRQRCVTCRLRHAPVGDQVQEAQRRRAMVPEEMRTKLTKRMREQAPTGTKFCAGCQSYRDEVDFRGSYTQCWACRSARAHASTIEKTYGLTAGGYDELLRLQGGRCAICRAKPKSKRLAVDHDHGSGAVRGLLCSRCNHDLMGSAWDSLAMATALWHYMNTPPATGSWLPPEQAPTLVPGDGAPAKKSLDLVAPSGKALSGAVNAPSAPVAPQGTMVLPIGSEAVPGKRGVYRIFVTPDGDPPF